MYIFQICLRQLELCTSLADVGKRICTECVHPEYLSDFVASRLIPLDKCPRVRPIGIGEVPRRIISNAILKIVGRDVQEAAMASCLQTCTGFGEGCEAVIHTMKEVFDDNGSEGVLLVDAENA